MKTNTLRSHTFERLPFYLCIQLRRFDASLHKISGMVQYPLTGLNLKHFTTGSAEGVAELWDSIRPHYSIPPVSSRCLPSYDLYAVVCHRGNSMVDGHYTAYALSPYDKKWYCFSNSTVTHISQSAVVDKNAYLLFYRRSCVPADKKLLLSARIRAPMQVVTSLCAIPVIFPQNDGIHVEENLLVHDRANSFGNCFLGNFMTSV